MPGENVQEAAAVLVELSRAELPGGSEYPWKYESERWAELLINVLNCGAGVDRSLAVRVIYILNELGALEPAGLSTADADRRQFLLRVLVQGGVDVKSSGRCADLIIKTAAVVQDAWKGYIQRFLREAGDRMAGELAAKLRPIGLDAVQAQRTAVMWLQNVCQMPILSPNNPAFSEFCKDFDISEAQLMEVADRNGLNVAALGEFLISAEDGQRKKASIKRRAPPRVPVTP